jgi:hypothetical protein
MGLTAAAISSFCIIAIRFVQSRGLQKADSARAQTGYFQFPAGPKMHATPEPVAHPELCPALRAEQSQRDGDAAGMRRQGPAEME